MSFFHGMADIYQYNFMLTNNNNNPNNHTSNSSTPKKPVSAKAQTPHRESDEESSDSDSENSQNSEEVDDENEKGNSQGSNILPSSYIKGVIVAIWDNTMGPRALRVWHGSGTNNKLESDLATFLTRFTITDEISRDTEIMGNVEFKFSMFSDVGIMVLTSVFQAKHRKSNTIYTLSLVLPKEHFKKYLSLSDIVREKMCTLTELLQKLCNSIPTNVEKAIAIFELQLRDFIDLFDVLNGIPPIIQNQLSPHNFSIHNTISATNTISSSCPFIPATPVTSQPLETKFLYKLKDTHERDFLASAITSHLQTHGYSVIIGQDKNEVNRWVNTLSLFLSPKERMLCRHAHKGNEFVPELYVQGLLIRTKKKAKITSKKSKRYQMSINEQWKRMIPINGVLSGRYPITVVDLNQKQTRSFKLYNFFYMLRRAYLENINTAIVEKKHTTDDQDYKTHFMTSTFIAPSVKKLMENVFSIPPNIRLGFIAEWMRQLSRKALVVARYVEKEIFDSTDSSNGAISKMYVRSLIDLPPVSLHNARVGGTGDQELDIVLAAAEKIQSGVYMAVTGDPQIEMESVMEFLEGM